MSVWSADIWISYDLKEKLKQLSTYESLRYHKKKKIRGGGGDGG